MAAPNVLARFTGKNDAGGTSHSILLPPSSPGDLLLVVFTSDAQVTVNVSQGNNWTKVGQRSETGPADSVTGAIFYKVAVGGGGDFLTLSTSSSQQTAWIVYRISNGGSVTGSFSSGDVFNRTTDPPSHTTPLPGREYLWIATRHADEAGISSSAPSNFVNLVNVNNADAAQGVGTSAAEHQSFSETINPSPFGTQNVCWACSTLCVVPPTNEADVTAHLHGEMTLAIVYGAGVVSPRTASLVGTSSIKVTKTNTSVFDVIEGMKGSFAREDHDWRMMSASHYQHRSHRSETMLVPDPNDPNKFIPITNTITTIHRNEIYSIESQPLGIGVSIQADFEDGNLEEMILHFNGSTYDIYDLELLSLLRQKGSIAKSEVRSILNNLITNDPPPVEEEE